jgi:hypothetical protein
MAFASFRSFCGGGTVAMGARETNPEVESSNLSRPPYKSNEPILLQTQYKVQP